MSSTTQTQELEQLEAERQAILEQIQSDPALKADYEKFLAAQADIDNQAATEMEGAQQELQDGLTELYNTFNQQVVKPVNQFVDGEKVEQLQNQINPPQPNTGTQQ